jgi:hypothetical protein
MDTKLFTRRKSTRIPLRILFLLLIGGMIFALASCRRQVPFTPRILREGDNLNGMVVTTGIADAPPLEAFCNFKLDEDITPSIDCQVPPLPKLAIGHMIGLTGGRLQELDWSKLDWQVYLDGYRLDLETFGGSSYVEPEIMSAPSPIREVFKQKKTWDIVLINPTFGLHTLLCTVKTNSVVYDWAVNFMIYDTRGPLNMVDQPTDARSNTEGMARALIAWDP